MVQKFNISGPTMKEDPGLDVMLHRGPGHVKNLNAVKMARLPKINVSYRLGSVGGTRHKPS